MKIGLFFGSFNPTHIGHLIIAQYMVNQKQVDQVQFVISPHNPLKKSSDLLPLALRLEILKLSMKDNPAFSVNETELSLPTPSYTSETLRVLQERQPHQSYSVIMGSDAYASLRQWKNPERILQHEVLVYKRAGTFSDPFPQHRSVHLLETPLIEISATMIRELLQKQLSVKYLVNPATETLLEDYFKKQF